MSTGGKRALALVFLAATIALVIVALVDDLWVDQKALNGQQGQYELALRHWQIKDNPKQGDSPSYGYDQSGDGVFSWNDALMGSRSDWQQAGRAATGLGIIGVVFAGLAAILLLVGLGKPEFNKVPGAVLAFLSGLAILLGAILFEGLRPSFKGQEGYDYPMGLYLAGGVCAEFAAIAAWAADYIPAGKDVIVDNRA